LKRIKSIALFIILLLFLNIEALPLLYCGATYNCEGGYSISCNGLTWCYPIDFGGGGVSCDGEVKTSEIIVR